MTTFNHLEDYSLVSNAFGFLRSPLNFVPYDSDADVVVTGVPFDMATSGRSGTRFGPQALRNISTQLVWEECRYPWNFNVRKALKIVDCGDVVYDTGDSEQMQERLSAHIAKIAGAGKLPVNLGGDHFITLAVLRGLAQVHGRIALLHFDAHSDTYEESARCNHGTMFYQAPAEGLIDPSCSVQVGIRTEFDGSLPFTVLDGNPIERIGLEDTLKIIKETVGDMPVHLSFDIDCLDPAYAPGTGTPVCGGLTSGQALSIIRALKGLNFVGMDLVEVSPPYDHSGITALAGATLIYDFLHVHALNLGRVS